MKRAKPGYTLIELMVVVILIGVITALAAPQISEGLHNNAVSESSNETVMAFRGSRRLSVQRNRAIRVFLSKADQLVRVDQSTTNGCSDLPVCSVVAPDFGGAAGCGVSYLNLKEAHFIRHGVRLRDVLLAGAATSPLSLCVLPQGKMVQISGAVTKELSGQVEVIFDRLDGTGSPAGVPRRVLVGSFGIPRVLL